MLPLCAMDVALLSTMLSELILTHDRVGLPGLGTFVAEQVPASFSDKGYTINPPYRRLSFYPSRSGDSALVDLYAASNGISKEAASRYVGDFLSDLKLVLEEKKLVVLPGLGRLRATVENNFFFVPDEDLDIFPEGFALPPVSLKTIASPAADELSINPPLARPRDAAAEALESLSPQPDEPSFETVGQPPESDEMPLLPARNSGGRRGMAVLLSLIALAVILFASFVIIARVAPDIVDSMLYTPEELRIINY